MIQTGLYALVDRLHFFGRNGIGCKYVYGMTQRSKKQATAQKELIELVAHISVAFHFQIQIQGKNNAEMTRRLDQWMP